jgi:hypothetical protein
MSHRRFALLFAALVSLAGVASSAAARERGAGATVEAIWHVQVFDFQYRAGRDRYLSCSSLHGKIKGIMEAMGAGDVAVDVACDRGTLVGGTHARIATAMAVPATPENVRAATTFDTEQEMIARLREATLPTADSIPRFPAEWRELAIVSINGVHVRAEDCDLLRDVHDQILPQLASVRVVRKRFSCGGDTPRLGRPILVVQALVPHRR